MTITRTKDGNGKSRTNASVPKLFVYGSRRSQENICTFWDLGNGGPRADKIRHLASWFVLLLVLYGTMLNLYGSENPGRTATKWWFGNNIPPSPVGESSLDDEQGLAFISAPRAARQCNRP